MCSIPPLYQSTGLQYLRASLDAKAVSLLGSMYLKKYHEEPAHCGIVSVSRFAFPWHLGHVVLIQSESFASGLSPFSPGSKSLTSGNFKGNSFSGIGCQPQCSQ